MSPELKTSMESISGYSKTVIDLMKHLTSLCVGTIVVVATFHDKLSKEAHWTWLLPVAMVLMLWCVALALKVCYMMMFQEGQLTTILVRAVTKTLTEEQMAEFNKLRENTPKRDRILNSTVLLTNWSFGVAVSLIALFIVRNFLDNHRTERAE